MPSIEEITDAFEANNLIGPRSKDPEKLLEDVFSTPLFMTEMPLEEDIESNETLSAIQSLIYDAPPQEIVTNFKNHGSEAFNNGQMREAVEYYSKALDVKLEDSITNSLLLCNRAAAQIQLKNYGMALKDCALAIRFNRKNLKAFYRSAKALQALDRFSEAAEIISMGLDIEPDNVALRNELGATMDLLGKAQEAEKKRRAFEEEKANEQQKVLDAIRMRGITVVHNSKSPDDESPSTVYGTFNSEHSVHLDPDDGKLVWPVLFLYPEYQESDLISSFHEDSTFGDHLDMVFEHPAPWDAKGEYRASQIEVYFETKPVPGKKEQKDYQHRLLRCGRDMPLGTVLSHKEFVIVDGMATFFVIPKDTAFSKEFKKRYKRRL